MDGWGALLLVAWLALAGVGMISDDEKTSSEPDTVQLISTENNLEK